MRVCGFDYDVSFLYVLTFLSYFPCNDSVCYRINRKAQGTQLIKWEGIGEEKHTDLVQEWHEHVDM